MRGIGHGATAGAAVVFAASWFLPWMGDTAAFPLLGHAFTMWYWFSFDAPGLGTGLEMALFGLIGLFAIGSAGFSAHRTAAVTAIVDVPLGVHLMARDHPGLDSGPGPLVAAVALTVLAVAQVIAFRSDVGRDWRSAAAGAVVAALLAVATGFGGAAYASARDVDATTSGGTGAVTVAEHDGALSGVTARDNATGAERWHYWARDWAFPSVRLSGDGHTVFVTVQRANEHDAFAFDALSGNLRWQRMLTSGGWPGPTAADLPGVPLGSLYDDLGYAPGLLLVRLDADELRYIDADGHEGAIRLDKDCGISGVGGVRPLYVVEQCLGRLQVFAAGPDGQHRWTTPATRLRIGEKVMVADKGDTVVVTTGANTETFDAATGNPRR
jgi:hypothetical protein